MNESELVMFDPMFLIISAAAVLPFIAYGLIATFRRQSSNRVDTLLGLFALIVPLGAWIIYLLVNAPASDSETESMLTDVHFVAALLTVVLGGVMVLLEIRRGVAVTKGRGVLSIGIGVLLFALPISTPILLTLTSGDLIALADTGSLDQVIASTDTTLPSPTPSLTPTLVTATPYPTLPQSTLTPLPATPTPRTLPTILATIDETFTPAPNTFGETTCTVTTGANLNLRTDANMESTILLTIPNSSLLTTTRSSVDRAWWQVSYQGQAGWVSGDYLFFTPECDTFFSP